MRKKWNWKIFLLSVFFCMCLGETAYANQWKKNDTGWWYQMDDGSYLKSCFADIDGKRYYFQDNGYMATGWIKVDGNWYYMDESGVMLRNAYTPDGQYYLNSDGIWDAAEKTEQTGKEQSETAYANQWKKNEIGWWYQMDDGSYLKSCFADIGGKTYYFQDNGYMATGWIQVNGNWYYMDESGAMLRNAYTPDGQYYLNSDGIWDAAEKTDQTGEEQSETAYANQWKKDEIGWWYQMDDGSYLKSCFADIGGERYYFQDNGYMATGWIQVNGNWYYMDESGVMLRNAYTPDGQYYLNSDGIWDAAEETEHTDEERNVAKLTIDGEEHLFYLTSSDRYGDDVWFTATSLKDDDRIGPQLELIIDVSVDSATTLSTANNDQELKLEYYEIPGGARYSGRSKRYYESTGRLSAAGGKGEFSCTVTKKETLEDGIHIVGYFTSTLTGRSTVGSGKADSHEVNGSFDFYEGEKIDWIAQKLNEYWKGMREIDREPAVFNNLDTPSSSSSLSVPDHTCRTCHGSGKCYMCHGNGANLIGSEDNLPHRCYLCNGTGKCQICYGTGKVY